MIRRWLIHAPKQGNPFSRGSWWGIALFGEYSLVDMAIMASKEVEGNLFENAREWSPVVEIIGIWVTGLSIEIKYT